MFVFLADTFTASSSLYSKLYETKKSVYGRDAKGILRFPLHSKSDVLFICKIHRQILSFELRTFRLASHRFFSCATGAHHKPEDFVFISI